MSGGRRAHGPRSVRLPATGAACIEDGTRADEGRRCLRRAGRAEGVAAQATRDSILERIWALGRLPMSWSTRAPSLKKRRVGMPRMPKRAGVCRF